MSKDLDLILSLTGRMPLDYKFREDGSLVVILENGQKFIYSKEQVDAARQLGLPSIQVKMPATQPMPKSSGVKKK